MPDGCWKLPKSLPVSGLARGQHDVPVAVARNVRIGLGPARLLLLRHRVGARVDRERVVAVRVGHVGQIDRVALAVGADEVDRPARKPRLARIAHVVVQVVELGAGLGRLLEVAEVVAGLAVSPEVSTMS